MGMITNTMLSEYGTSADANIETCASRERYDGGALAIKNEDYDDDHGTNECEQGSTMVFQKTSP